MKLIRVAALVIAAAACKPSFSPPRESIRVTGSVTDGIAAPVEVHVYERCSPRLYLFKSCPGKLIGKARIARPGPFLVEIDTRSDEVSVVAFRGVIGGEDDCAVEHRRVKTLSKRLELSLSHEPCPISLPPPIRASARAPVSGF